MNDETTKIKIRQIEAFRSFMLTDSVTLAAQLMHISQPAVSRLLSDLEYRVGFALFIRTHNKIVPTPEAHWLYQDVAQVFVGMEKLAQSARAIARNNHGKFRLAAMPIYSDSFLSDVIAEFTRDHPNVVIELESAPRNQLLEMVRSRQVDTAIITDVDQGDATLESGLLCSSEAVVVLPAEHRLKNKSFLSAEDLADERFMVLGYGSPFRIRVEDVFIKQRIKRHIVLEAREQSTLFTLVQKGVGIAILDPLIVPKAAQSIITRPFEPCIEWQHCVVHAKEAQQPAVVHAFNRQLQRRFSPQNSEIT